MRARMVRTLPTVVGLVALAAMFAPPANAGGGGCYRFTHGRGETIEIVQACFTPNLLHVAPGTRVTFVNRDPFAHNVSAYGWGWYDDLGEGQAFRATFREPGIYPFACTIHPGMTGAIVVGNGTGVGSSERVDVAPVVLAPQDAGPPAGSTPSVVPLASESVTDTSTAGWWIGGALGFALGVGSAVATRARRLWRAARSRPAGAAT